MKSHWIKWDLGAPKLPLWDTEHKHPPVNGVENLEVLGAHAPRESGGWAPPRPPPKGVDNPGEIMDPIYGSSCNVVCCRGPGPRFPPHYKSVKWILVIMIITK